MTRTRFCFDAGHVYNITCGHLIAVVDQAGKMARRLILGKNVILLNSFSVLTHIRVAFLWNIGKQYSLRCDTAKRVIPSGAFLRSTSLSSRMDRYGLILLVVPGRFKFKHHNKNGKIPSFMDGTRAFLFHRKMR